MNTSYFGCAGVSRLFLRAEGGQILARYLGLPRHSHKLFRPTHSSHFFIIFIIVVAAKTPQPQLGGTVLVFGALL